MLAALVAAAFYWLINRFLWQDERSSSTLIMQSLSWGAMMAAFAVWQSRRARAGKVSDFHPAFYLVFRTVHDCRGYRVLVRSVPAKVPE
ncbi:MAG: hypothetical protein IPP98_16350 [Gemmatimonadetes bacterium]|nr:hypothetical protein [Gemmatimonadota bacterium]